MVPCQYLYTTGAQWWNSLAATAEKWQAGFKGHHTQDTELTKLNYGGQK